MLLLHEKHNLTKEAKPLRYSIVDNKDEISSVSWQGTSDLTRAQIMSKAMPGGLKQAIVETLTGKDAVSSEAIQDYLEQDGYTRGNVRTTLSRMLGKEVEQDERGKYRLPKVKAVA
jgi:hypothetical protein